MGDDCSVSTDYVGIDVSNTPPGLIVAVIFVLIASIAIGFVIGWCVNKKCCGDRNGRGGASSSSVNYDHMIEN